MKTSKFIVAFVGAILLAAASARAMVESDVSGTRTASCLLRVSCAPEVLPLSYDTIRYLLHSSSVGGKAAKDVLGIPFVDKLLNIQELTSMSWGLSTVSTSTPDKTGVDRGRLASSDARRAHPVAEQSETAEEPQLINDQIMFFRVEVDLREEVISKSVKPAGEEFMNAVIKNMSEALNIAADSFRSRIRARINLAAQEADRTERELMELQAKLRELSGSGQLSSGAVLADISSWQRELQSIAMKGASQSVTIEAITKKIAEAEAKATEKLKSDPVTNELQRLLELQILRLDSVKKLVETGHTSQADLADAEERLARARIELAKRREELTKSTGGDLIASLNKQLSDLSIETAQYEARRSMIEHQLDEAKGQLARADEYELLSMKADIAKQNLQEALRWLDRMSREERLLQLAPTVTVLGTER
jgi:hypothetical protein